MTVLGTPGRKAFNGLALALVRARAGESGEIVLTARADGLGSTSVSVHAR